MDSFDSGSFDSGSSYSGDSGSTSHGSSYDGGSKHATSSTEPSTPSTTEPTEMRPKLNPEPTTITIDIREEVTEGDDDEEAEPGRTRTYIDGIQQELNRSTAARMRGRHQMNRLMALAELTAQEANKAVRSEGKELSLWGAALATIVLSYVCEALGWEVAAVVLWLWFWVLLVAEWTYSFRCHRARRRAAEASQHLTRVMDTHVGY